MRVKVTLAYNGTSYLGSQRQKSSINTVNGQIELVLKRLNINTKLVASGRTDKGVHATGQVIHIDIPLFWNDIKKLQDVLNKMLPKSIAIKNIQNVNDNFHARYDAKKRVYRYIIKNEPSNPFEDELVSFYPNIDLANIKENVKLFEGRYDFESFIKKGSDTKSTIREIYKALTYTHKGYTVLYFEANGFLRSQIRLMVGALLTLDAKEIQEQLRLEVKHKIKPAKANGLYLAKIKY